LLDGLLPDHQSAVISPHVAMDAVRFFRALGQSLRAWLGRTGRPLFDDVGGQLLGNCRRFKCKGHGCLTGQGFDGVGERQVRLVSLSQYNGPFDDRPVLSSLIYHNQHVSEALHNLRLSSHAQLGPQPGLVRVLHLG
jgi:hypothetical protein